MKKVITILAIMLVVFGAVFATVDTDAQKLTLVSVVDETDVAFVFQGKLASGKAMAETATTDEAWKNALETTTDYAGATLTAKSIADNDIVANFRLAQSAANVRYKGTVTFTFTAGALTQQAPIADGETAATVAGTISAMTASDAATYSGMQGGKSATLTNKIKNTVTTANSVVTAKYNGKVAASQEICTFTVTWLQDDTLPNGTYKADITVTISAS